VTRQKRDQERVEKGRHVQNVVSLEDGGLMMLTDSKKEFSASERRRSRRTRRRRHRDWRWCCPSRTGPRPWFGRARGR